MCTDDDVLLRIKYCYGSFASRDYTHTHFDDQKLVDHMLFYALAAG